MTTIELLNALEARVNGVRTRLDALASHGTNSEAGTPSKQLEVELLLAGLTEAKFASLFRIPAEAVRCWVSGSHPVPDWVLPAVRMYTMVPDGRQQQIARTRSFAPLTARSNAHPFSRIEDL